MPKERTVRIVLNSGANIHAKNKAVADYWAGIGFPEIYWEDGDE